MRTLFPTLLVTAAFLSSGCQNDPVVNGSGRWGPVDPPAIPTAPGGEGTPTPGATPVGYPRPCHPIYADDLVPTFRLTIEDEELSRLRGDHLDKTWRPAVFEYEGESYEVMVKNRGNKVCGTKLQLGIAFNKVDPAGRFQGLRRLVIDHANCRVLDERLALAFLREDLGEPAACANHAAVYVNGELEGVYTNLEAVNKDWLTRNFGPDADGGNLWKEGYELDTNEETGTDEVLRRFKDTSTYEEVAAVADVEHAIRYWAIEATLPATDNFYVWGWNYALYEHPTRGMVYVPRDYDKAMPWGTYVHWDPLDIGSRHHPIPEVLANEEAYASFLRGMHEVLAKVDPEKFRERTERYWLQVGALAAEDDSLSYEPDSPPPPRILEDLRARIEYLESRLPPAPE